MQYEPLASIRVIERATTISARYCGRILSDLGARVVRSEPHPTAAERCVHDPIGPEIAAWLDHGKPLAARSEAERADLLICDSPSFDREQARSVICITPFGKSDYARPASELVVQHASGFAFHQAMPVSDPERLAPRASSDREAFMSAGVAAALACVWSVLRARDTVVDFSVCDFLSHLLVEAVHLCAEPRPVITRRRAPGQAIAIAGGLVWLLPCTDGDVMISPREEHQWRRWVELMGSPAWTVRTDLCGSREARTRNTGELQALMSEWSRIRTQHEVFEAAQSSRIACFPVSRPADLLSNAQLEHRGFFDRIKLANGEVAKVPGLPFHIRSSNGRVLAKGRDIIPLSNSEAQSRPGLESLVRAAGKRDDGNATGTPSRDADEHTLAGIRVIDFSWVMAGPMCTKMLGAMGAEVIKVESSTRAEFKNRGGWFDILNNNKVSCSINITNRAGQELVRKLAAQSHVLVENFSAGVLPKYGLGYEDLRAINPALIYVSGSGVGRTGPLRDALAYGTLLQAFSGRCALVGTPNPSLEAMGVLPAWTDPVTAFWETLGIVSAIAGARRTGEGTYIDISMLEGTIALLPESLLSAQGLGVSPAALNTERNAIPSGCYRCSDPDGWVALAVRSNAEWQALCRALNLDRLSADLRLQNCSGRHEHAAEIHSALSARICELPSAQVEADLHQAGIPASKSRNIFEVVEDHDRRASGLFPRVTGGRRTIAIPWTDEHGWRGRTMPGPSLGEHTDWVLTSLLHLGPGDIAALKAEGAVG